jgi:RNA polymerase sigma-70 factor (ECF subfamily)
LKEHGPAIWRAVASYAPPGAERDDLAQDVLLSVWQGLGRFRGDSSLKAFVLRIAHNRGLSLAWKRSKQQHSEVDQELPDPKPLPDERLVSAQQHERFMRHLRTLALGQRWVLALALEGLSHAEIAAIVGITKENVAVRLGRAKEALKQSIEKEAA